MISTFKIDLEMAYICSSTFVSDYGSSCLNTQTQVTVPTLIRTRPPSCCAALLIVVLIRKVNSVSAATYTCATDLSAIYPHRPGVVLTASALKRHTQSKHLPPHVLYSIFKTRFRDNPLLMQHLVKTQH